MQIKMAGCNQTIAGLQTYSTICYSTIAPEVSQVAYVGVLKEKADSKETTLHVISELHVEHVAT